MQGARVRSLVGELDPTCMPQLRVCIPQLRSPCAATKELASHNEGALEPKLRSLPAATKEPMSRN